MTRGRKADGAKLVERLQGSAEAKNRLQLILKTFSGRQTVAAACLALGIGERRFHAVRNQVLQVALTSLEPRAAGRHGRTLTGKDERVSTLEAVVRDLKIALRASQIREEVALTMPQLLHRPASKKAARRKRQSRMTSAAKRAECNACKPSNKHTWPRAEESDAATADNDGRASWNEVCGLIRWPLPVGPPCRA